MLTVYDQSAQKRLVMAWTRLAESCVPLIWVASLATFIWMLVGMRLLYAGGMG